MSNKARKSVWDAIHKKAKKIGEIRKESREERNYVQEILRFLNNLDVMTTIAENELDFRCALEKECSLLDARLRKFDPKIKATVEWNDTKDWKKLRPLGVSIYWSKYYLKLYPDADEYEYVDVGRLLIDDY